MTVGIEERLGESNYIALLGNTSEMLDKQNHVLSVLQEFPADGLLLCPVEDTSIAAIQACKQDKSAYRRRNRRGNMIERAELPCVTDATWSPS